MNVLINLAICHIEGNAEGAYAFWISSDHGGTKRTNLLKEVLDPEDAYLQTVEIALDTLNKGYYGRITRLFVEVDSEVAFSKIRRSAARGTSASRCYRLLQDLKKQHIHLVYQFSIPGKKNANHLWCSDIARRSWEDRI